MQNEYVQSQALQTDLEVRAFKKESLSSLEQCITLTISPSPSVFEKWLQNYFQLFISFLFFSSHPFSQSLRSSTGLKFFIEGEPKCRFASDWLALLACRFPGLTKNSGIPSICLHMESLPVGHFLFTSESVNEGHPGIWQ